MQNVFVENIDTTQDITIEDTSIQYTIVVESVEENEVVAQLPVSGPSSIVVDYTPGAEYEIVIENYIRSVEELGLPAPSSDHQILEGYLDGTFAWVNPYTHPSVSPISLDAITGQVIDTLTTNSSGHVTGATLRYLQAADIPTLPISKITGLQSALDERYTEIELQGDGTAEVHWNNITNIPEYLVNGTAQYQILVTGVTPFEPDYVTALNLVGANGLNSLSYASASFVKMTGANTFSLDTNTYSLNNHTHGNISNDGKIGSTSGLMIKTGASGLLEALVAGTSGQYLKYDGTWDDPISGIVSSQWTTSGLNIYYTTGNVGIGTNNPVLKTHIISPTASSFPATSGTTQTGGIIRMSNIDHNAVLDIGGNKASGFWLQVGNQTNLLPLYTYPLLLNPNGGNVGIGTTSSSYKLDVNGTGNFVGALRLETGLIPDAHDGAYLGTEALGFSDLYLATGAVITFGAASTPNYTITHSADLLSFSKNISIVCGSDADGDIWYRSGGKFARLAKGTAGQVLKMNSGATAPEWGAGGSVSFGTDYQIPFMKTSDDDFQYSSDFMWDGKILTINYGNSNILIGNRSTAPAITTDAIYNTFIGLSAGNSMVSGDRNTFLGHISGGTNTGSYNTFLGASSGYNNASGDGCVFIGYNAGYRETGSDKLFIDNQDRSLEATARISSLIYGEFNATPSNQLLRINGVLDHSLVPNKPKIYSQATEPNIPNDTMAFWKDTDDSKYYLILDIGGTQKKVELT